MPARILVVEDEEEFRLSVTKVLRRAGHDVDAAPDGASALALAREHAYRLLVTDFRLPDVDGLALMRQVRAVRPDCEVLVMTAYGNIPLAVEAVREGAWDFLTKPFKKAELEHAVAKALEKQALAEENRRLRLELSGRGRGAAVRLIGNSAAMQRVLAIVEQVAASTATVLITGESGTGKEGIAEALHALSARRDQPLVKVNCAALPETLLEAELFGHERGAFTGAVGRRDGRFAMANRGTLLLDEIGSVSPAVQVKLLRVLQDGAFEPLGSGRTIQADVRVVAATNANLAEEERLLIQETLRSTGGNKQRAADLLGIAARTIYRKL